MEIRDGHDRILDGSFDKTDQFDSDEKMFGLRTSKKSTIISYTV